MDQNIKDLISLCSGVVNGTDVGNVQQMDLDGVLDIADHHLLAAVVAYAFESAGISNNRISSSIAKAQRKAIILEIKISQSAVL